MIPANDGVISIMQNLTNTFETGVGIAAGVIITAAFLFVLSKIIKNPVSAIVMMLIIAAAAGVFYSQNNITDAAKATFQDGTR